MDKSNGQLHTDGQIENSTRQEAEAETTETKQIRTDLNVLAVGVGVPVKRTISNDCHTHGNAIENNNIKTNRTDDEYDNDDELPKRTTNLSNGNNKHKQHCDIKLDSETKQICEKETIAIDKPNHETIKIKANGSIKASHVNDKNNILHDACNLHEEIIISNGKSVTKLPRQSNDQEIKTNGSLSSARTSTKKAISLEKIDETVKKFIGGEVIVDKENPFKKLNAKRRSDFFSSVPFNITNNNRKTAIIQLPNDEFITTKDVLNESKYVKTYIKNPDEYFIYDPTLKERLLKEEQRDSADKRQERISQPKKSTATRISRLTHERLKELKNKYSPSPLYSQQRTRSNPISNGYAVNGGPNTKLPKVQSKKIDRSKYPDLSQIKVKTGTDLEGSFFNPKEVAINAKKFDARIKNTQFGSQDDLDEIADLTSDFDANGFDELDAEIISTNGQKIIHGEFTVEPKEAESLTNTINSKEFQEYLAKKGLTLTPEIQKLKANRECVVIRIVENKEKMASPTIQNDVDSKKSKKPSVLQRLFPNGFFSSRRRTTPKEMSPEPIKLVANEPKKDGRLANAKRLVLHRQSMPAKYDDYDYRMNSNLKTIGTFGSSSSISSTLTNSEYLDAKRSDNCKLRQTDSDASRSLSGLRYIDSSSNSTIVTCDKNNKHKDSQQQQTATKPVPRPRQQISGRLSVPVNGNGLQPQQLKPVRQSKENVPMASQRSNNMGGENRDRDSVPKPRAQRPKIPIINSIRPLVNAKTDENGLLADGDKKRISKLHERLNKPIANSQSSKLNFNEDQLNRSEPKTPDTPNKTNAPKSTSTPLAEYLQPNFHINKNTNAEHSMQDNSLNISPIPKQDTSTPIHGYSNVQMDANTWAKVHELKEKSDRQLYAQPLLVQAQANMQTIQYDQRHLQPMYDRLPHNIAYNAQPLYAKVEKKSSIPVNATLIRNAPQRQSLDQFKMQSNQQQQHQQQQMSSQTVVYRPVFIRNSPQRNTVSGVYRGTTMQRMSPQICQTPIKIVQAEQPQRPQSVLDEMMTGRKMQPSPTPSIQLRRKGPMSRGEIMNQVVEFCRKSMNKTPTKFFEISNERMANIQQKDTNSSEVSPISYASVATSKTSPSIASSQKIRPQVPIRKQSLQQQQPASINQTDPHSIYEHIPRHNQVQTPVQMVNDENKPANGLVGHYAIPTKRFIIMDSKNITPAQVKQYHRINGDTIANNQGSISSLNQPIYNQSPVQTSYGRIHLDTNPYDYIHVCGDTKNPTIGNNLLQIYQPNTTSKPPSMVNGRFTPIMLPTIPQNQQVNASSNATVQMHLPPGYTKTKVIQKPGRIVVLNNVEQMYRPIAMPTKTVRHQTSQTSLDCRQSIDTIDSQQANQIFMQQEDWQNDKGKNQQNDQDERRRGGRNRTPDDNRRHTLSNDMMIYAQQNQNQLRSLDLEQPLPVRGYAPVNQGPLFDDDPGIMSEVETASTGFRRGNKTRSSLPVVRTPSKTLERPLGLVFLQYRSETKRALLPNEITSIDTVRALFVRSFPRQLTMNYLEGPNVKIYIHDANKDMFYELEDVRSHLREIRDRSVLRLFESNEVTAPQVLPAGPGVPQPLPQTGSHWDQDQYFSEPEFDTEYSHQHVHKNKGTKGAPYYVGAAQTLPRGMYSDRNKNIIDGYMSSPERGTRGSYEEPYYSQYGTRGSSVAPIIDEELSDVSLSEDQYALYGGKSGRIPRNAAGQIYDPTRPEDLHRIRVEHMERQLANLTGLVQKALHQTPPNVNQNYLGVPGQYRDKSVSFEKSVSFSDDIQGLPKSHNPQHHVDSKPPKPAIKSSTLPRTSSQERDRLKPAPPPKPMALAPTHVTYRPDLALAPEVYNHLRGLQKRTRDLRMEARTLRRLTQAQAVAVREDIKDAFMGIRATLLANGALFNGNADQEKTRLTREEELYKQEVLRLEKDLCDLESSVEILRGEVINRRTRVNMAAVEDMALILSRASKTVAELKLRFPILQITLRNVLSNEMEKVVREEKFLSEEPDRLESALRRCKKLTGTLVTLKRLASVQEQRLPGTGPESSVDENPRSAENHSMNKSNTIQRMGSITLSAGIAPENALDALLDELQTFSQPAESRTDDSTSDDSSQNIQPINNTVTTQISQATIYSVNELAPLNNNTSNLRRLHSYPSGSDTDTSPPQQKMRSNVGKPPVPERNSELLSKVANKRAPPAPPPRTSSSKSPLPSPTTQNANTVSAIRDIIENEQNNGDGGNSSGNESTNSQERQAALEFRHQELLKKQKQLQEQYARLQRVSKTGSIQIADTLKKTGSESNLPQKMGLNMAVSGSMKNLNVTIVEAEKNDKNHHHHQQLTTTIKQVYETDIL